MKPEIAYVYNTLKRLRFDFNKTDFECFRNQYRYEPLEGRYVRKDDNDLLVSKDAFKPLEEELEYADKCHELESGLGCPLEVLNKIKKEKQIYINTYVVQKPSGDNTTIPLGIYKVREIDILNNQIQCLIQFSDSYEVFYISTYEYKIGWFLKENRSE